MATGNRSGSGPGPEVMSADSLIGDNVINDRGEDLGKIEELMIDMETGKVNYAVLSFGGFMGVGGKLFAVPFTALHLDPGQKRFVLRVDKERLRNAPGFDRHNWPRMGNRQWGEEIHSYYRVTPYWQQTETHTENSSTSGTHEEIRH